MSTVVASFVVILFAVAAMALGVLFGRAPIRGSCGGVAGGGCSACTRTCRRRAGNESDDVDRQENSTC